MEIKLTEKQIASFNEIATLKDQLKTEFNRQSQREQELLTFVIESAKVELPKRLKAYIENGVLHIVDLDAAGAESTKPKGKVKKLKKEDGV